MASIDDTLRERMTRFYDSETIRRLAGLFGPAPSTRKEDRLDLVVKGLEGDGLKWALDHLDDLSRMAIAEAAFDPLGRLDPSRFRAKYGDLPKEWSVRGRGSNQFFGLFIINGSMPSDLRERVRALLAPPPEMKPRSRRELPRDINGLTAIAVHTEEAALHNVMTVLNLIAGGMVTITPQRQEITTRAVRAIAAHLLTGNAPNEIEEMLKEPLYADIWPNLIVIAHLAREGEKQIELTRQGQKALTSSPHEVIRNIWARWIATKRHNEIEEFDESYLSLMEGVDLPKLRSAVIDALVRFPVGEWVETEHLVNYIKVTGSGTHPDWRNRNLVNIYRYGYDQNYDQDFYYDQIESAFNHVFLRAFAAVMGIVDIAYIVPENVAPEYLPIVTTKLLKYVRVTPLGAYCLGITEKYSKGEREGKVKLKVLPTLEVVFSDTKKTVRWETFFLERIAERTAEHVWRLDRKKILTALEEGIPLDRIREALTPDEAPLPDTVARFLEDIENREKALQYSGEALLFETRDEATADLLAHERKLQGLCLRAGERILVVPEEKRKEFLKVLKKMGYLARLPKEKAV